MCIQPTSSAFPPAVLFRLKFHDSIRFTLFCFQCHHYFTRLCMHSWIKYIPKHCLFLILCTHLVDLKVLRQIIRCDPDIFNIYWAFFIYFINFRPQYAAIADYFIEYYNVSVKSIISFVFAQISDLHLFTRRTLKTE